VGPRREHSIVVWAGSGFSKAWDQNFPLGKDVFNFSVPIQSLLKQYLSSLYGKDVDSISYDEGKSIVYRQRIEKEFPFLESKYRDSQYASLLENEIKEAVYKKFLPFLASGIDSPEKFKIHSFMDYLSAHTSHSGTGGYGLRLDILSTNYDFNLETALDFKEEDYLIYRGFTPITTDGHQNHIFHRDDSPLVSLIKLNGSFEILESLKGFFVETRSEFLESLYADYSVEKSIILPSAAQDYRSKYFRTIFPKAIEILKRAKILLFIGTSLPDEDVLFTQILSHFAEQTVDYHQKKIVFVTLCTKSESVKIMRRILSIFPQYAQIKGRVHIYNKGLIQFIEDFRSEYIYQKSPLEGLPDCWNWSRL